MISSTFAVGLIACVIGILPSVGWLFFVLSQDRHPEQKRHIVWVFVIGMFVSLPVIIAVQGVEWGMDSLSFSLSKTGHLFLTGAVFEELLKGGALYLLVFYRSYFSEPIDTFVYGATLALGFAAIENIIFITGAILQQTSTLQIGMLVGMRAFTAVVVHFVSSAFVAYGLYVLSYAARWNTGVVYILGGIGIHGGYNMLLSSEGGVQSILWGYALLLIFAVTILYGRVRYLQRHSQTQTHLDE